MTKKLYNFVENESDDQKSEPQVPEDDNKFRQNLNHEVKRRNPFRYEMKRFMCKKNFASPWCLCCRHTDNRDDKLQGKARTRLYAELDILQIIQKLRVARFVAQQNLSDEQRYLVNYHSEYMLTTDAARQTELNASRYLDHRGEATDVRSRDERIEENVEKAISHLNPGEESHRATYAAIMGRGRQQEDAHAQAGDDDNQNDGGNAPPPTAGYNPIVDDENNNNAR